MTGVLTRSGTRAQAQTDKWEWVGEPIAVQGRQRFYAGVRMISEGREREYKLGDGVVVKGDDGGDWYAHLVELLEDAYDTTDAHVVEDDTTRCLRMRCTLRWLHERVTVEAKHTHMRRLWASLAPAQPHELCFTDHLEGRGNNPLEIILGRVQFVDSLRALKLMSGEEDAVRLVRLYYNTQNENGGKCVRELEHGELHRLLRAYGTEKHFSARWGRLLVRKGLKPKSSTTGTATATGITSSSGGTTSGYGNITGSKNRRARDLRAVKKSAASEQDDAGSSALGESKATTASTGDGAGSGECEGGPCKRARHETVEDEGRVVPRARMRRSIGGDMALARVRVLGKTRLERARRQRVVSRGAERLNSADASSSAGRSTSGSNISSSSSRQEVELRTAVQAGASGVGGHAGVSSPLSVGGSCGASGTGNSQSAAIAPTPLEKISQVYASLSSAEQRRASKIVDTILQAVYPSIAFDDICDEKVRDNDELVEQVLRALLHSL